MDSKPKSITKFESYFLIYPLRCIDAYLTDDLGAALDVEYTLHSLAYEARYTYVTT